MSRQIDVMALTEFIDTKLLEMRKLDTLPFAAKMTAYNLLIDLQEWVKQEQEKGETDSDRAKYL